MLYLDDCLARTDSDVVTRTSPGDAALSDGRRFSRHEF